MAAVRPYHVVVWGASGFTGKLVCEHLAADYSGRVQWAMAGRNRDKLEASRKALAAKYPAAQSIPILVADPQDKGEVGGVLRQARAVVCTTGPFAKYANVVVQQSVEQGTHYCDITGEVPWVKTTIKQYHSAAAAKGVKVVHCCGFDSIPSDLGALMMAQHCRNNLKQGVSQVWSMLSSNGSASGGTIATALGFSETHAVSELMQLGSDAYYLASATPGFKRGTDRPTPITPSYCKLAGTWMGPLPFLEVSNKCIVHLSNALAASGAGGAAVTYGKDFKYQEGINMGSGVKGLVMASALSFFYALALLLVMLPPVRWLLHRVVPAPGTGPTEKQQREGGYWRTQLVALTEDGTVVKGTAGDPCRDPGYWSTSRMVLEAALCMALDQDKLERDPAVAKGGVLTPATAMGATLIQRLQAAGQVWRVDA